MTDVREEFENKRWMKGSVIGSPSSQFNWSKVVRTTTAIPNLTLSSRLTREEGIPGNGGLDGSLFIEKERD